MQRITPFRRTLTIDFIRNPIKGSAATFLWGPRQSGKSTLMEERFANAKRYDLLDTDTASALSVRPKLLREQVLALCETTESSPLVIVDEVQKIPALLEEVHWLLEHSACRFILCGSSARKLRRQARNLLGGRATEHFLFPLTSQEIGNFDLLHAVNVGTLPVHYLTSNPKALLSAYVNAYIKEEIIDESATRNVPAFSRFLHIVSLTHGQQLNYTNIARESGVSPSTVRSYFQILQDTLLGFELAPWRKSRQRRLVETAKFFLFDIGVANALDPEIKQVLPGTDHFGRAFEHLMLNEVRAYLSYRKLDYALSYWRTSSGFEVDIIVGNMRCAIECKSSSSLRQSDLKGIRALRSEFEVGHAIVVSRENEARRTEDGIDLWPWTLFLKKLWTDEMAL